MDEFDEEQWERFFGQTTWSAGETPDGGLIKRSC